MSGIHIDEFYADAAKAIVSLYSVFPRPITLFAEDICGPDQPDEYGVHSNRFIACFSTMLWLGEEGYLRYKDTIRQEAIDQVVISGRCFAALLSRAPDLDDETNSDQLPPSVQAHQATTIYQLEQALKSRSSVAIQAAFWPLLGKMVRENG